MKFRTEVYALNSGKSDKEKENAVTEAKKALDKAMADYDKSSIDRVSAENLKALAAVYAGPKESLNNTLKNIQDEINEKNLEKTKLIAEGVDKEALKGVLPSAEGAEAADAPDAGTDDYFTQISLEISSDSGSSSTSDHSARMASQSQSSHGWWFWRSTSSESSETETSSADSMSKMATANVKVSFECMRVDIERPWMRPELFYDDDLRAAPGAL